VRIEFEARDKKLVISYEKPKPGLCTLSVEDKNGALEIGYEPWITVRDMFLYGLNQFRRQRTFIRNGITMTELIFHLWPHTTIAAEILPDGVRLHSVGGSTELYGFAELNWAQLKTLEERLLECDDGHAWYARFALAEQLSNYECFLTNGMGCNAFYYSRELRESTAKIKRLKGIVIKDWAIIGDELNPQRFAEWVQSGRL